jgi:hypothetical protein
MPFFASKTAMNLTQTTDSIVIIPTEQQKKRCFLPL